MKGPWYATTLHTDSYPDIMKLYGSARKESFCIFSMETYNPLCILDKVCPKMYRTKGKGTRIMNCSNTGEINS